VQIRDLSLSEREISELPVIDCTFSNISASAEGLLFFDTAISAAAFIGGLITNVVALPQGVNKDYQEYRHLGTKPKIARAIFISVRDQPELDPLFDANRCFEIRRKRIADAYWTDNGKRLVKRNLIYRTIVWPFRFATLGALQIAGFLTNWGRSPFRSVGFLIAALTLLRCLLFWLWKKLFGSNTPRAGLHFCIRIYEARCRGADGRA
jgi:hypothetical protein